MGPPVLKRRHSLAGKNILPVKRKVRGFRGDRVQNIARVRNNLNTEELLMAELSTLFGELTGENEREVLAMAGREHTEGNLRILLHCSILQANETGEPNGQGLRHVCYTCIFCL